MYEIQLSLSNNGDARKSVVQQAEEEEEEGRNEGAAAARDGRVCQPFRRGGGARHHR